MALDEGEYKTIAEFESDGVYIEKYKCGECDEIHFRLEILVDGISFAIKAGEDLMQTIASGIVEVTTKAQE